MIPIHAITQAWDNNFRYHAGKYINTAESFLRDKKSSCITTSRENIWEPIFSDSTPEVNVRIIVSGPPTQIEIASPKHYQRKLR